MKIKFIVFIVRTLTASGSTALTLDIEYFFTIATNNPL